ncbi:MAG: glycosyltransferase family 4 protein [Candidatus Zambryskibacteria bacterium]|nr:glycosyltransferase family 4 protein [Candidatus Zambryskibacteria bacterium]
MKILFLSDDFPPQSFGGAGISTYDLARGMKKAGQEVFVITTCRKKEEAGELEYQGLKIFKIASDYPGRWRTYISLYNPPVIRELEKILKKIKPDVVHANNIHFYLSYHSLKIAKKYAKVVITFRDVMSFNFGKLMTERYLKNLDARTIWLDHLKQAKKRWNPLRNIIIKYYLGYADKKFAVSKALKKALEQNGISGIEVIHTGIDLSEYPTFYNGQNKKIIFFAGRLSDAKGAKVVEKAMQIISKKMPDAELITAGTGGKWLNREEMKMAYASSSVVIVPSVCFDALPRTVLEASASGRPVISTPYGGAKEVIEDGVTGYIIDPFKPDELAEKIIDLLKDPRKAEKFGKAGYQRIEREFSLEKLTNRYIDIYAKSVNM